jgi:hypothetical protein
VAIQEGEFRQHGVSIIQQFVEPERKGGELQEERGDLEC